MSCLVMLFVNGVQLAQRKLALFKLPLSIPGEREGGRGGEGRGGEERGYIEACWLTNKTHPVDNHAILLLLLATRIMIIVYLHICDGEFAEQSC